MRRFGLVYSTLDTVFFSSFSSCYLVSFYPRFFVSVTLGRDALPAVVRNGRSDALSLLVSGGEWIDLNCMVPALPYGLFCCCSHVCRLFLLFPWVLNHFLTRYILPHAVQAPFIIGRRGVRCCRHGDGHCFVFVS